MPVIVSGSGRCGSSFVARVLHEELGVFMGDRFDPPSRTSPEGSFEDLDFRDLNVAVSRGELTLPEFRKRVERLTRARFAEYEHAWGFKDPRASHLIGLYMQWIDELWVIQPTRGVQVVVESIHRHYGTDREEARGETIDRLGQLDRLRSVLWRRWSLVDMSVKRSREFVGGEVEDALKYLGVT